MRFELSRARRGGEALPESPDADADAEPAPDDDATLWCAAARSPLPAGDAERDEEGEASSGVGEMEESSDLTPSRCASSSSVSSSSEKDGSAGVARRACGGDAAAPAPTIGWLLEEA